MGLILANNRTAARHSISVTTPPSSKQTRIHFAPGLTESHSLSEEVRVLIDHDSKRRTLSFNFVKQPTVAGSYGLFTKTKLPMLVAGLYEPRFQTEPSAGLVEALPAAVVRRVIGCLVIGYTRLNGSGPPPERE